MRRSAQRLSLPVILLAVGLLVAGYGGTISSSIGGLPSRTATVSARPGVTVTVTSAPTAPATDSAAPAAASGTSLTWLWVLLGVLVLAGLIALIARSARRRSAAVERRGIDAPAYVLGYDLLFALPGVGPFLRRLGAIPASTSQAEAALARGACVLVYPGGDREACRPWTQRNEVDFDGRTGFVRLALQCGVPVIPVAAHGGHHAVVVLARGNASPAAPDWARCGSTCFPFWQVPRSASPPSWRRRRRCQHTSLWNSCPHSTGPVTAPARPTTCASSRPATRTSPAGCKPRSTGCRPNTVTRCYWDAHELRRTQQPGRYSAPEVAGIGQDLGVCLTRCSRLRTGSPHINGRNRSHDHRHRQLTQAHVVLRLLPPGSSHLPRPRDPAAAARRRSAAATPPPAPVRGRSCRPGGRVRSAKGVRPRHPAAERTVVADLVRRPVEPGVPVVLGAARPAPQRHMAHAPAPLGGFPGRVADARHPGDFLRHTGSKRMPVRTALGFVGEQWCRHPMIMS